MKAFIKGDIVKVTDSPFKGIYGEFLRIVPKEEFGKSGDGILLRVFMFQKYTNIVLWLSDIGKRKIIPECYKCWEHLPMNEKSKKKFLESPGSAVWCKKCLPKILASRKEIEIARKKFWVKKQVLI